MNKDELEIEKLRQEIKNLKKPILLRPEFLSIVFSSIFAAATIYFSILKAKSEELETLKSEKIQLANQINQKTSLDLKSKEEQLKQSIVQLEIKEDHLRDSLNHKFIEDLLILENKLKEIRLYIDEYKVGYSNARLKSKYNLKLMDEYVKQEKQEDFKRWFYRELNMAIDRSNTRSLNQIELERKLSEYKSQRTKSNP